MIGLKGRHHEISSSENSVSMEATNSEDEQVIDPLLAVDGSVILSDCPSILWNGYCELQCVNVSILWRS
jgi:hypothetical protein